MFFPKKKALIRMDIVPILVIYLIHELNKD